MIFFTQDPVKYNAQFIDRAREAAREFGEGFVVFVGSMAVLGTNSKESAQAEARQWAAGSGRSNVVKIRRIRVPDVSIK